MQHFLSAVEDVWRDEASEELYVDLKGSLQLLNASHVRERDKALLRGIMTGGVWNGFRLGHVWREAVPCRFCGGLDGDGHLFWECTFPPLVSIRENPEFHEVSTMDKSQWPWGLLCHGWLPSLSGRSGACPWAETEEEVARNRLETCVGAFSAQTLLCWDPAHGVAADGVAGHMSQYPNVWSDGSLVLDSVSGISAALSGIYYRQAGASWDGRTWGHLDQVRAGADGRSEYCCAFCSVPGPLQTAQRAELWGGCGQTQRGRVWWSYLS